MEGLKWFSLRDNGLICLEIGAIPGFKNSIRLSQPKIRNKTKTKRIVTLTIC